MFYGSLALIIANFLWGAGSPIFKVALDNIPPFTLAFLRFFGATLILLPFAFRSYSMTKKDFIKICLGAFFGVTINIAFFFFGLEHAPSINSPIINSAGPVFLFLWAIFCFREKAEYKVLLGMIISLVGVLVIIVAPVILSGSFSFGKIEGNLYFLVGTVGALLQPIFLRGVLKRIPHEVVTFYAFLFGAISFFPGVIYESSHWSLSQLNNDGLVGIIWGIVCSSVLAYSFFHYGLSKLKLQEVGVFSYVSPIAAVLVGLHYGEYPSYYHLVGGLLICVGLVIAERRIHDHRIHQHAEENM